MKCSKCNGFMYVERYYDNFLRFDAWKCINCGSIVDTTILENQGKVTVLENHKKHQKLKPVMPEPLLAKAE